MSVPVTFQEVGPDHCGQPWADLRGWIAVPAGAKEVGAVICRVVSRDEFEILYLTVAPRARRHGVGQGLVAAAMEDAVLAGHQKISARVPSGQSTLLHLLLGLGFRPVATSQPGGVGSEPLITVERHLEDWLDDELLAEPQLGRFPATPTRIECEAQAS